MTPISYLKKQTRKRVDPVVVAMRIGLLLTYFEKKELQLRYLPQSSQRSWPQQVRPMNCMNQCGKTQES
jgi:hypothetical protein